MADTSSADTSSTAAPLPDITTQAALATAAAYLAAAQQNKIVTPVTPVKKTIFQMFKQEIFQLVK